MIVGELTEHSAIAVSPASIGEFTATGKIERDRGFDQRAFFSFEQTSRYYCEAPFSLYAGGTVEIQKSLIARSMGIG